MFNLKLGTAFTREDGRSSLRTHRGVKGYALYGPYEFREPGSYSVDFRLAPTAEADLPRRDKLCATIDVASDIGTSVLAKRRIMLSDLRQGERGFRIEFTLRARSKLEYRVWTSGAIALDVDEHRRVCRREDVTDALRDAMRLVEFPAPDDEQPAFFRLHHARFRRYFDNGFDIAFLDGQVVLSHGGISFFVRTEDDFNFIGEVLITKIYDFIMDAPACVIDIGMNIGYSTLQFARKPNVREIFSYEPFPETFQRAVDNLELNPDLIGKVQYFRAGLSDKTWSGNVMTGATDNSGSRSVAFNEGDRPVSVQLLDAGATLGPILESARARGLRTVLKVDCEGSEYAIFRSLSQARLFDAVDVIMVEWHAMFDKINQHDLIAPLREAGFVVFDQSPPTGNGFFYAARLGNR